MFDFTYLIVCFFAGVSVGCIISIIVHNVVYK